MTENNISQQAQIISPVHDPLQNGFSKARIYAMIIGLILCVGFGSFALVLLAFHKLMGVPFAFLFCISLTSYIVFARDEQTLSHNLEKYRFKKRQRKGFEGMGKYDEKVTEKKIKGYISWKNINERTGLSEYEYPNSREYIGNFGFSLLAVPPAETDKDTMNEKFRRAFRALPNGSGQKIILMTGIDPKFILNDIEDLLKEPGLSPVRRAELKSMQKKFSQQMGSVERTYLIHIMLPYTVYEEKAQVSMDKIMNGYIKLLNRMKIKTILITEHQDMIDIFQGVLTGTKIYGVV